MTPETDNLFFRLIGVFLDHVHALEHLADITHVEHVVRFSWRGQELLSHLVEESNSCKSEGFALSADFLVEVTKFHLNNGLEDALHVCLAGDSVVDQVELRQETA